MNTTKNKNEGLYIEREDDIRQSHNVQFENKGAFNPFIKKMELGFNSTTKASS